LAESTSRRNPGWYVGVGLIWLIAAWLVIVGLSSIIPQIFKSPGTQVGSLPGSCTERLLRNKNALVERFSSHLSQPGGDRERLDAWLSSWDEQVAAHQVGCAERELEAAAELTRVRHALRDSVRKLDREQGPRIDHFYSLLGRDAVHADPTPTRPAHQTGGPGKTVR